MASCRGYCNRAAGNRNTTAPVFEPLDIRYLPAIGASPSLIRALLAGGNVSGDAVLQLAQTAEESWRECEVHAKI